MSHPITMDPKDAKFIFWEYDLYPFTLGAVAYPRPNGMWYAPSYQGTFKPTAIYEVKVGEKIAEQLKYLERARVTSQRDLDRSYLSSAQRVAPFLKVN